MMTYLRTLTTVLFILGCLGIQAKGGEEHVTKAYLFGFAASFNDSTVCFTDIQEVEGVFATGKKQFLGNREEYSYQLRNYLQSTGKAHPTCITVYAYSRKDIEKKYDKLRKKYTDKNKGYFEIVDISESQFRYQAVSEESGTVFVDAASAQRAARADKAGKKDRPKKKGKRLKGEANVKE